jgi:ribonuclease Z
MPPIIGSATIDVDPTPHYATGFKQVQPRLAMVTRLQYDQSLVPERVAGIRTPWDGFFQFGASDVVVVNVTKEAIWMRRATLPEDANFCRPSAKEAIELFDLRLTHTTVDFPNPRDTVAEVEGLVLRNVEYDACLY